MSPSLRLALVPMLVAVAAASAGCKVSCEKDAAGNEVCTAKLLQRFNGTQTTATAAWSTGQKVRVVSHNGNVTVRADGSAADAVSVDFQPFALDTDADSAKATLANKLQGGVATAAAGEVDVEGQLSGSGAYGYDIVVHVPAVFDGPLDVAESNGEVNLASAAASTYAKVESDNGGIIAASLRGTVYLVTKNGSVNVTATPAGAQNYVHTDNGQVDFSFVAGTDLTTTVRSGASFSGLGDVTIPSPTPASWTVTGESPTLNIVTGDGAKGTLEVSSGNGDVGLSQL